MRLMFSDVEVNWLYSWQTAGTSIMSCQHLSSSSPLLRRRDLKTEQPAAMASHPANPICSSPELRGVAGRSGDAGGKDRAVALAVCAEKSGTAAAFAAVPEAEPAPEKVVPRSFASFLPSKTAPATLSRRGRSWGMRFTGGLMIQRLETGWRRGGA
ncbi:hypothetical protein ABZP36_002873 [Zizania latifolia]